MSTPRLNQLPHAHWGAVYEPETSEPAADHKEEAARPFVVCPTCKGHGSHGPGFVYTQDDREELGEEFDEIMENHRRGLYDVTCAECSGARVVRKDCTCTDCEHERQYRAEAAAERAAEQRMGC